MKRFEPRPLRQGEPTTELHPRGVDWGEPCDHTNMHYGGAIGPLGRGHRQVGRGKAPVTALDGDTGMKHKQQTGQTLYGCADANPVSAACRGRTWEWRRPGPGLETSGT